MLVCPVSSPGAGRGRSRTTQVEGQIPFLLKKQSWNIIRNGGVCSLWVLGWGCRLFHCLPEKLGSSREMKSSPRIKRVYLKTPLVTTQCYLEFPHQHLCSTSYPALLVQTQLPIFVTGVREKWIKSLTTRKHQ